jgi:hypothetical protein
MNAELPIDVGATARRQQPVKSLPMERISTALFGYGL